MTLGRFVGEIILFMHLQPVTTGDLNSGGNELGKNFLLGEIVLAHDN